MDSSHVLRPGTTVLPAYPLLHTHDLDAYHALVTAIGGPHERRQIEPGPFRCAVHGIRARSGSLAAIRYNRSTWLRTRGGGTTFYLHVIRAGSGRYVFDDRQIEGRPGVAVLIPPGVEYEVVLSPLDAIVVGLSHEVLAAEHAPGAAEPVAAALPPRSAHLIDLGRGAGAILVRLLDALLGALSHPVPLSPPQLEETARGLHGALAGLLLHILEAETTPARRRRGSAHDRLQLVSAYVEANLHRTIRLEHLCRVAGLGPRYLQRLCREHWDLSPLQFVQQCRLERVRTRLCRPSETTTVSDVALECGFAHLGRFAAAYARHYQESPSATLARARGPVGHGPGRRSAAASRPTARRSGSALRR